MNKPVIVLKALLAGLEIDLGSVNVSLETNEIGLRCLVHIMWNQTNNKPVYIRMPIELDAFINLCERMDDKAIALIGANLTLNEIKHEGADRRPKERVERLREDSEMRYRGKVHSLHHPEPGVDLP